MRTTSDSSATREACTGTGSRERRYLSVKEPWQEARRKNESQLVSEDTILNRADIETEIHTSERLTFLLRQTPLRRLVCLTLTMSERRTPCKPRRGVEKIATNATVKKVATSCCGVEESGDGIAMAQSLSKEFSAERSCVTEIGHE